jgi:hypothetical protein
MPFLARVIVLSTCILLVLPSPATAAEQRPKCRYTLLGQLPIQYHGNSLSLALEGQINQTPAVMLLDTGATDTFLTRFGTEKRKLRLGAGLNAVTGVGGTSRLYLVKIRQFQVGPIQSEDNGSLFAIDKMGSRPDFDAIVGSDFLLGADVELSLAEKRLKFFSPENCDKSFLGYWDAAAIEVPLLFESGHRRPHVEVEINGVKIRALIDTGATISVITKAAAKRAGVTPESPGVKRAGRLVGIGQKSVDRYRATFKSFSVGEEMILNPVLQIVDDDRDKIELVLGADFLRSHRVLFAVSQMKVYLSYIGGKPFDDGAAPAWVEQEAKAGNGYAQFFLAMSGLDSDNAGSRAAGLEWMDKAIANKNLPALLHLARQQGRAGRHADSVATYENVVEQDAYDMTAHLELFVMRMKAGLAEPAKSALEKAMANFRWPPWPAPITDYYLGKLTLDDLLRDASSERDLAKRHRCEVFRHARALQDALGHAEPARTLAARADAECGIALNE